MEQQKKRKSPMDPGQEGDHDMMVLLKRLHLDKTSELYEKVPLFDRKPLPGSKRWRLSPIKEHSEQYGGGAKRRRVDSDMAEHMSSSLWISAYDKEEKEKSCNEASAATKKIALVNDAAESLDDVFEPPDSTPKISLNIDLKNRTLGVEEALLRRHVKEQNMQLVLWSVPLVESLLKPEQGSTEDEEQMEFDVS